MDRILTKLDELTALQNKVIQLEATVDSLSSAVVVLNQEVAYLKEKENHRDQQERGNSARLFGLCIGLEEEDPMALAKRVYDTVVRPVLVAAKANKHIEAVPNLSNALKEVYRARGSTKPLIVGQPPPPPPLIIVKFSSSIIKKAFFMNKKASMPTPSPLEVAAGIKRFTAVEDLTVVCYKKLREMNDCVDIDKVWSVEGKLRYTLTGDSTVRKVKSVFDSLQVITNRG